MSTDPKFLWDVGYLENLKTELGDKRVLLCLSPLSFRLLANMSNMLTWPTRFGLSRGEPIPNFIQDCYGELNNPQDIVGCFGSDVLEDLIVNSEDIMIQITNNIDCCCGVSSSPSTIFCVGQDGAITYTPQVPVNPTPTPPEGLIFPFDPDTDAVPGEFADWNEYDAGFCAFANGLWEITRLIVSTTETLIDILAAGAALAVVLTPLLPAGVLAAIGGVTFLEVVWELVKIITSEQASDILNEIVDWLDDAREEIVCTIYSHRYDWGGLGAGLSASASDYIETTLTLSPDERNAVQNLVSKIFFWQVAAGYVAGELGLFSTDAPIDCSLCSSYSHSFDYVEPFDTNAQGVGVWEGTTFSDSWRSDNGGECYTIGHTNDPVYKGWAFRGMLSFTGLTAGDVEDWYLSEVRFVIARNTAQAPESNPFCRFEYDDGTYADTPAVNTSAAYTEYVFANPYPGKPLWKQSSEIRPGVKLMFPGVPGASTWFEYFITAARMVGGYDLV